MKLILDYISNLWNEYIRLKMSRDEAHRIRRKVVSAKGRKVVDRELKKQIKGYCRKVFGSASYWPWLALYTELRGEFKKGWMPDDYYRFEFLPRTNPEKYMRFSEAKTIDHKIFNGSIIEPLFLRPNGHYYDRFGTFKKEFEVQEQLRAMDAEIVIKPDNGRSGKSIIFKHSSELNLKFLPGDTPLLFQKVVRQHSVLHKLYPYSVNTFRVVTFIDERGAIQHKYTMIRFGRGGSRVDNMSSGGCGIFVQPTGALETCAYNKIGLNIGEKHPDTGGKFCELQIPGYQKILELCKRAHKKFPYTRLIGWDVFINEEAVPKLIEWNANNPGIWVEEALYGPFFCEEFSHKYTS